MGVYRAIVHYKFFLPSLRKVAKLYNISKSSLQRWVHNDPSIRKIRSKKQTDHLVKQCLQDVIQKNPFATWAMIAETLSKRCQLKASRATAGRLLKKEGFTRKRACRIVDKVHDPATVLSFCHSYQAAGNDVVCIDEAGFYVGEQGRMGYSKRGKRLNVKMSRSLRRVKYTLIMAVSSRLGIVQAKILDHNCRKADFVNFIQQLNVPSGTSVLMDNVAFHHSASTSQAIVEKGFVPLFIPPYSPKVNAIENVFGVLKSRYRKRCPVNYKQIMEDILAEGIDCEPFFARVNSFIAETLVSQGIEFCGYDT